MQITTDFRNYVLKHTSNESFLYNNRLLISKLITSQQYEMNRDYILAKKAERGF